MTHFRKKETVERATKNVASLSGERRTMLLGGIIGVLESVADGTYSNTRGIERIEEMFLSGGKD